MPHTFTRNNLQFHLYSKIKLLIFSSLFVLMASCKKDIPPPLECDLSHPDQICREDAFRRGQFLGYIEYSYLPNNQLFQKKYYSVEHSYLEETYEYNDKNLLVYQKGVDKDGSTTEEKMIAHTEFDSISTVTIIKNGGTSIFTAFEYDSLRRLKTRYDFENDLMEKRTYIYGDDGKIFSETFYDNTDQITKYKLYKNYLNNITKIYEYNGEEQLLGIEVLVADKDGNLEEIRKYDKDNVLKQQETFLYVNKKLIKHAFLTGDYETEFRLFHYP